VDAATAARTIAASRLVEAAALGVLLGAYALAARGVPAGRLLAGAGLLAGTAVGLLRWLPWLRPRLEDGRRLGDWRSGRLLTPLAFGIAAWTLQWATYHWSIAATYGGVTRSASGLALLLANLGGILRLTPGNVGVVQGAIVLALAPAGVPAAQAIAAGLALQAVEVIPVMLIGVAILGRYGLRKALRPVDGDATLEGS
jgi:uncharacterized membrane protein YbhN (UPF0104 family)